MAGVQPAGVALLELVPEAGILCSGGILGESQKGGAIGRFRSTWRRPGEVVCCAAVGMNRDSVNARGAVVAAQTKREWFFFSSDEITTFRERADWMTFS